MAFGFAFIFSILVSMLGVILPAAADDPVFLVTAVPNQDEMRNVRRFSRFAQYLEEKLGVPVRYAPTRSYSDTVKAFIDNDVQLAWFGGLAGLQARSGVPGSEAIALGAEDTAFKSYFIANLSSGLEPSKEFPRGLTGKSAIFGPRTSTSGRLMPEYFIRQALGKSPDQIFSRVDFSENHSNTLELVQSGAFQVGVLDYSVYETEKKAGNVDENKVRVIWETPPYTDYHFSIRGDVDAIYGAGFKEKVRRTILGIKDKEILAQFDRSSFVAAKNDDFSKIEEIAYTLELLN
jgi:phosphonate transport system substrate-binding protein